MNAKKRNIPTSHMMELPRQIVVGEKNIDRVGEFLESLARPKKVSIISGNNVIKKIGKKIDVSLKKSSIRHVWHLASSNHVNTIKEIEKKVKGDKSGKPTSVEKYESGGGIEIVGNKIDITDTNTNAAITFSFKVKNNDLGNGDLKMNIRFNGTTQATLEMLSAKWS